MYVALIALLLGVGVALCALGLKKHRRLPVMLGGGLLAAVPLFFGLLSLWGEALWFMELGQSRRFWVFLLSKLGAALGGALIGAFVVYALTLRIAGSTRFQRFIPEVLGAGIGALWGLVNWDVVLRYWHAVETSLREPILGRDTGFYLFKLPLYYRAYWLLLLLVGVAIAAAIPPIIERYVERNRRFMTSTPEPEETEETEEEARTKARAAFAPLYLPVAALLLVLAWGRYLARFRTLYSELGAVHGAGWTAVHVRLPMYLLMSIVLALAGLFLLVPPARRRLENVFDRRRPETARAAPQLGVIGAVGSATVALWILLLGAAPALVQWLRVNPNELTLERPYLEHNIAFTRHGFRLHEIEEKEFPVSAELSNETVARNQDVLSEVRLWDPRAIEAVYQQFQAIRLYYDIGQVDIDRYKVNGRYRQVMISAREMNQNRLAPDSQTFVNRRFKYTHGNGVVMAPVSEFEQGGLPAFLVQDIPPRATVPSLEVDRPEIYFGEQTHTPVYANSTEPEFDYPSGRENVYAHYQGEGGIQLASLWRKFLLGWKLDGTPFLMSSHLTSESRIMFRRAIAERVQTLAPFLELDEDPYVVVANGKVYWMVDAYTTSRHYPYSEPFSSDERIELAENGVAQVLRPNANSHVPRYFDGANYIRNSVKVVVDAFDGAVTFYVFEPDDPIIQVWQRVLPDFFKSKEHMPLELLAHVRYPEGLLLAQGIVYEKYHMADPRVFYNQEDLWSRATERYYDEVRPVDPYYIMWKAPGAASTEFILMQPFTPRHRQVLIGWLAGRCDGENYGKLLTYRFPKDTRVLGTQQVDTRIDQDPYLAAQIGLWDQRGSNVIRGNVLVIPIEDTLLYVEPIYIQAEAAPYPELRVVVLMHNDRMNYASTFDQALRDLLEGRPPRTTALGEEQVDGAGIADSAQARNDAARVSFERYARLMGEKRFVEAAQELERLAQALAPSPTNNQE